MRAVASVRTTCAIGCILLAVAGVVGAQETGNVAVFVSDVTIPDGMVVSLGQRFTKTWRFKNDGSTNWNGYSLVFVQGNQMSAPGSVSVPPTAPGSTVDISVPMTAPSETGPHQGHWQMHTAAGTSFGNTVFVLIRVSSNRTLAHVQTDLGNHSPYIRRNSVAALGEFGVRAVPALAQVLKNDPDTEVRVSAIGVLADVNPLPKEALGAILTAIGDPDPTVGSVAAMVLAGLTGPPPRFGPEVVSVFVDALTDPNPIVQQASLPLLVSLGPTAREAIPALREFVARYPDNESAKAALRVIEGR